MLSTFLHIANADGTVNAHDSHLKKLLIASCFGLSAAGGLEVDDFDAL